MSDPVWKPTIHKAESEVECYVETRVRLHLTVCTFTSHSWFWSVVRVRASQKYMVSSVSGEAKTKSQAVARAIRIANEFHMWKRVY